MNQEIPYDPEQRRLDALQDGAGWSARQARGDDAPLVPTPRLVRDGVSKSSASRRSRGSNFRSSELTDRDIDLAEQRASSIELSAEQIARNKKGVALARAAIAAAEAARRAAEK